MDFFIKVFSFYIYLYNFNEAKMPPKLTAAEIEANDAAKLNELGYKQVI
jgi:hypothetical protein